jgi:poly(3-hydroxybutyrate) depolymerase
MLLYQFHELWRAGMAPYTYWAEAGAKMFSAPGSWLAGMPEAPRVAAGCELIYRIGKDYEKPEFHLHSIEIDGQDYPVVEREILATPFCRLLRFKRYSDDAGNIAGLKDDPPVLVVPQHDELLVVAAHPADPLVEDHLAAAVLDLAVQRAVGLLVQ